MPTITPCLWMDHQGEEAAQFYCSLFPNSAVTEVVRYSEVGPGEPGSVMLVYFTLDGQPFSIVNGGPMFTLSEAVSFEISCRDQAEVDHYWDGLIADSGEESQCGWLKDKYGVSWQVTPTALAELTKNGDPEVSARVMQAMLQMKRLVVADLEAAARG